MTKKTKIFQPPTHKKFSTLTSHEQALVLVQAAHHAPSSHNSQPWRFRIPKPGAIEILIDRTHILPESDPTGRQAIISIGCAIENMLICAKFYSLSTNVVYSRIFENSISPLAKAGKNQYTNIATITYKSRKISSKPSNKILFTALWTRHVTRAEFNPAKPIPKKILQSINAASSAKAITIKLLTSTADRLRFAELQGQADGYVMNLPPFSKELGTWLLPNTTPSPVGMPGSNFGMHDKDALRIHQGLLGTGRLEPEDMLKFASGGKVYMEKSPLIGLISCTKESITNWLDAGRTLERILLVLDAHNIAVSIHAGVVEVPLIHGIYQSALNTKQRLVAVFRAGYLKNPSDAKRPPSPRYPITDILVP